MPDNNFEQALIFFGYDDILDDSVNTNQIKFVENLNLTSWISDSISDLTGIEDFENLKYLQVYNQLLTELDLSNNTQLTTLKFITIN